LSAEITQQTICNFQTIYNNIVVVYKKQGDHKKALEYYKKALKICEKVLRAEHPDTKIVRNNYEELLEKIKA